jgi:stage II sporulation protein AA (anti-sigma F factor antagonist)
MIGIEIKEKFSLLRVSGDLSEDDLAALGTAIDTLMIKGYRHVVLDLQEVAFMNARGLGALVNHWGQVRFKRGDLKIVGLNSRLMHLFRSMGVEQIFEVFPDVQNMMEKKGWLPAIA